MQIILHQIKNLFFSRIFLIFLNQKSLKLPTIVIRIIIVLFWVASSCDVIFDTEIFFIFWNFVTVINKIVNFLLKESLEIIWVYSWCIIELLVQKLPLRRISTKLLVKFIDDLFVGQRNRAAKFCWKIVSKRHRGTFMQLIQIEILRNCLVWVHEKFSEKLSFVECSLNHCIYICGYSSERIRQFFRKNMLQTIYTVEIQALDALVKRNVFMGNLFVTCFIEMTIFEVRFMTDRDLLMAVFGLTDPKLWDALYFLLLTHLWFFCWFLKYYKRESLFQYLNSTVTITYWLKLF